MPYLAIVLCNVKEVVARAIRSVTPRFRIENTLLLQFFRRSDSPFPIGFAQAALPISIDDLLTAIQEQFGTELRENHISIVVDKN